MGGGGGVTSYSQVGAGRWKKIERVSIHIALHDVKIHNQAKDTVL